MREGKDAQCGEEQAYQVQQQRDEDDLQDGLALGRINGSSHNEAIDLSSFRRLKLFLEGAVKDTQLL